MKAAVFHGRNDVRLEELPPPTDPQPGWVNVAVTWCGICGTDIEEITLGPTIVPTEPHPLTGRALPITLGHEGAGAVVARGDGVALLVGTRVAIEGTMSCGSCHWCRDGNPQLCPRIAGIGFMLDGALAEQIAVPAAMCVALPDGVSDAAAAFAEPLSIAVRAERRSGGVAGRTVQVVGAGTIGLLTAQVARARGARSVAVRYRSTRRRELIERLGFVALGPAEASDRADVVFDCGSPDSGYESAIDATDRGGTTVIVAIHPEPRPLDLLNLFLEERTITAVLAHTVADDFAPAVDLLAEGKIQVDPLVSARIPLGRIVEDGFGALIAEPARHTKILVDCRP